VHIPDFMVGPLVNLALPTIVTAIAAYLYQNLKKGIAWLNAPERAKVHEYVFGAFAILQPILAPYLAQFFPGVTNLDGVTQPMVASLVGLLAGKIAHGFLKK
jgi:hypothetical protein